MAKHTVTPEFDVDMEELTPKTPGHADQWNVRHQQLLNNDEYLYENKVDGPGISMSVTEEGILQITYDDGEDEEQESTQEES